MGGILSELGQMLAGGLRGARKLPGLPVARMSEGLADAGGAAAFKATTPARQAVRDVEPTRVYNAQKFANSVKTAKKENRYGAAVELKSVKDYKKTKMFMTDDRKSGFALKSDGDLVSVFSREGGTGRFPAIMKAAIRNGATKLDAFDIASSRGGLPEMYGGFKFKEYERWPWNEQYAPSDWPAYMGTPDIAMMHRPDQIVPRQLPGPEGQLGLKSTPQRTMRPYVIPTIGAGLGYGMVAGPSAEPDRRRFGG